MSKTTKQAVKSTKRKNDEVDTEFGPIDPNIPTAKEPFLAKPEPAPTTIDDVRAHLEATAPAPDAPATVPDHTPTLQAPITLVQRRIVHGCAFNITTTDDTEVAHAIEATSTLLPVSDAKFDVALAKVSMCVFRLVDAYGNTGYGNKPENLHRFPYWFQHLCMVELTEFVAGIMPKPHSVALTKADKPPSSALKCTVCKTKIHRGETMLINQDVNPSWSAWSKTVAAHWDVKLRDRLCEPCLVGPAGAALLKRAVPVAPLAAADLEALKARRAGGAFA